MKNPIYIGRQPILDRHGNTYGYEILFRQKSEVSANIVNNLHATSNVIENIIEMGFNNVIESGLLGFINILPDFLQNFASNLLPKKKIVFEILDSNVINEKTVEVISAFKKAGCRFALDDFIYSEGKDCLIEYVDYVKIDVKMLDRNSIEEHVRLLRDKTKLVAEKVETAEEYNYLKKLGFDYFQGYFFQKPVTIVSDTINPNEHNLVKILHGLQSENEIEEIEKLFKYTPELTFRMLKLLNSVSFGVPTKINSIKQAIVLLGYDTIYKWLLTLAFAGKSTENLIKNPILELAVIKGKAMEDLCVLAGYTPSIAGKAYLSGIISLIPAVLQQPLESVLKLINIDENIYNALSGKTGVLRSMLDIMDAFFASDYLKIEYILSGLENKIDINDVLRINSESLLFWEELKNKGF